LTVTLSPATTLLQVQGTPGGEAAKRVAQLSMHKLRGLQQVGLAGRTRTLVCVLIGRPWRAGSMFNFPAAAPTAGAGGGRGQGIER